MKIATGKEVYKCDTPPVVARGIELSDAELDSALKDRLPAIIHDYQGQKNLNDLLVGLATTSFGEQRIKQVLMAEREIEDWRIGEAIGEAYLTDHRDCNFPWPSGRDLRNPESSPAGADLVGFEENRNHTRFAFGEIKTSRQEMWPPSAMTGRHGLSRQLEPLRDSHDTKDNLVRYLGHRAANTSWTSKYVDAAKAYLQDHSDVTIHGLMIRDVDPKDKDLSGRCAALAQKLLAATSMELRAIYLPKGSIKDLPKRVASKRSGGRQ
jgi:hypothetical protein